MDPKLGIGEGGGDEEPKIYFQKSQREKLTIPMVNMALVPLSGSLDRPALVTLETPDETTFDINDVTESKGCTFVDS